MLVARRNEAADQFGPVRIAAGVLSWWLRASSSSSALRYTRQLNLRIQLSRELISAVVTTSTAIS
jgi:hypothetical protein